LVLGGDKQHAPYPLFTSAADLFAYSNALGLLHLIRATEENDFKQGEPSKLTDSMPGLTMGSTDRFGSEGIYNDTDSIRTDNQHNNLNFEEKSSYSEVFVTELNAGLDEVLRSKTCDHHARSCMSAALPDLLKTYALLLARRARSRIERDTITFVRHGRPYVMTLLNNSLLAATDIILYVVQSRSRSKPEYLQCPRKPVSLRWRRRWKF
jgi:hypothetical protein